MAGQDAATLSRGVMGAIGALAGLALWALGEPLAAALPARLHLAVLSLAAVGFAAQLLLAGPLGPAVAAPRALALGVLGAVLASTAALRFDAPQLVIERGHLPLAGGIALFLALPFVIALARPGSALRAYPTLFAEAWSIVLRTLGAGLFLAVGWLLLALSGAVLGLVGITLLERLLDQQSVTMTLSGAMLGLALAVLDEHRERLPVEPALRLLRLLAPLALALVLVFLAALALRGLEDFPGGSVAATVLALGFVALLLVVLVVERDAAGAASGPVMLGAAQGLCLVRPVLAGVAIWALAARVGAHGWSPARLAAALAAAVLLGHGLVHAAAVLRRGDWPARLRLANPPLALATLALALAWLTPVLNAERISAQSHLARFEAGRLSVAELDLDALDRAWGRPGAEALARLRQLAEAPGGGALAARLATLDQAPATGIDLAAVLADLLPVLGPVPVPGPGSGTPTSAAAWLDGLPEVLLTELRDACLRPTPGGHPGCALITGPFHPDGSAAVVLLVQVSRAGLSVLTLEADAEGRIRWHPTHQWPPLAPADGAALLDLLQTGAFRIAPPSVAALHVGGLEFLPLP